MVGPLSSKCYIQVVAYERFYNLNLLWKCERPHTLQKIMTDFVLMVYDVEWDDQHSTPHANRICSPTWNLVSSKQHEHGDIHHHTSNNISVSHTYTQTLIQINRQDQCYDGPSFLTSIPLYYSSSPLLFVVLLSAFVKLASWLAIVPHDHPQYMRAQLSLVIINKYWTSLIIKFSNQGGPDRLPRRSRREASLLTHLTPQDVSVKSSLEASDNQALAAFGWKGGISPIISCGVYPV